ncbi:MAG: tryptophan-rich sensory protein [Clostridia bacterium]|nr:tryptophan-rich sensory protein [Clostridia bacterium]
MNTLTEKNTEKWNLIYTVIFALSFLIFGFFSAILTGSSNAYIGLNKPTFSPPPELFAVVWSLLYVIIGWVNGSVYFLNNPIYEDNRRKGFVFAVIGFILNLLWYPLFFGRGEFVASFIDIIAIFLLDVICIIEYRRIKPIYGNLLIPYAIWLAFAAYLNLGVIILN